MNLYDELELTPNCTDEEIKQKYRSMAQKHHPDKGGDEERFKRIKLAYEVLSNPNRRKEYDETGKYYEDATIRSQALERLSNMVSHFTHQINPEFDDLILKMKNDIRQAQRNIEGDIQLCNEYIRKLKIILKKIRLKKEGENIIKTFTRMKLKQRENELLNFQNNITVMNLMLEILDDYHYGDFDLDTLIEHDEDVGG